MLRSLALLPLVPVPGGADDVGMFSAYCEIEAAEVLLPARAIETIDHDERGMVVRWQCRCGYRGSFRTGRPSLAASG